MSQLVSHFILENDARGQDAGCFTAVCLFVDVSGFTTLTETLMQQGKVGSEALAGLMSVLFEPLVESIYAHGGFVANFAGDAFTALFPGDGAPPRALAAAWAIRLSTQKHPRYATPFGEFSLPVRVALTVGEVTWGIIYPESESVPAAHYFDGPALEECGRLSQRIRPGEVVLSPRLAEMLAGWTAGEAREDAWLVTGIARPLLQPQEVRLPDAETRSRESRFLAGEITRLSGGEYRPAVTVFVGLDGVPTHAQLAVLVRHVFRLQAQYGGFLGHVGFDDKGCYLLLYWGAPRTFENDVERALCFLLDLRAVAAVGLRAAVTRRLTYTGLMGSTRRADYVCYGQGTNLAARMLMAVEQGQIWLDEPTARQAEGRFTLQSQGSPLFKGFAEPQAVYALAGRRSGQDESQFHGQMVGRQAELAQLSAFVSPLYTGRFAGVLVVYGDPGLGKSLLLHEFWRMCASAPTGPGPHPPAEEGVGVRGEPAPLWLVGQSDQTLRGSLNPFRYLLQHYLEQVPGSNEAENQAHFARKLDGLIADMQASRAAGLAAELERVRSFLGALVGLYWEGSLYEQVEPKLRFENTLYAFQSLIQAECLRQPVILVLEDTHWLDADSQKLLAVLTANMAAYPLAILCSSRHLDDGSRPELSVDADAPRSAIELATLPLEAVCRLAEQTLGGMISPGLVSLVAKKSEGNPFFVEQLLLDLRERGLALLENGVWVLSGSAPPADVPTTIQAVILARLDRLAAEVKGVVHAAAVLGREFEVRVLSEMLRGDAGLLHKVRQAEQEAIWSVLGELRYIFRHALLCDAAYEMQLRARLRELHALAAASWQQVYAADLAPHYADLAYHCDKAEDFPQAIDWYNRAAQRCADLYASEEARGYCSRALELAGEPGKTIISAGRRFDLLALREELLDRIGNRSEQWSDLEAMEAIAQEGSQRCKVLQRQILHRRVLSDRPAEKMLIEALKQQAQALGDLDWLAEAYYAEGLYYTLIDDKSLATASLEKALAWRQETGNIPGQMDCCCALAIIYLKLWQYAEAMQWIEKAQALNANQSRPEQLAFVLRAAAGAGLIYKDNPMCYRYASQLLDLATTIGDHKYKASAHLLRGQALCAMFQVEEGLQELELCLQINRSTQNKHNTSIVLGEIAYQLMSLGDFERAKDYFQRSMAIDQETHYPTGYCTSLLNLSYIALCQEDAIAAKELYLQGVQIARELDNAYLEAIAIGNLGEAEQLLGEYELSIQHSCQSIELLERLDQPAEVAVMQIDLAISYLKLGDLDMALQFAGKLIAAYPRANEDLNDAQRLLWGAAQVLHAAGQTERARQVLADAYRLYRDKMEQIPEARIQAAYRQLKFNRQIAAAFEDDRWAD